MQIPVCSSEKIVPCANYINTVDIAGCLRPCSGVSITNIAKSEVETGLDDLSSMSSSIVGSYNNYKIRTQYASGFTGKKDTEKEGSEG